jgi:hypothetical protein
MTISRGAGERRDSPTFDLEVEILSLDPPPGLSPEACRNSRSAL